ALEPKPRSRILPSHERRWIDPARSGGACRMGGDDMIVSAILSDKGRQVFTISPTATLGNAVKTMAEKRIGALVVTGAGDRLTGIVSERDIVRMLAAHGAA